MRKQKRRTETFERGKWHILSGYALLFFSWLVCAQGFRSCYSRTRMDLQTEFRPSLSMAR
ncbi:hypothetical protein AGABI2DRAFT_190908 [Agaricus bisporus var. bisporus H97]|uniref:hypothetical protein n=1 Tax=Agaricus bisporus var. bisporus (strain H97 / ATCC MYA-4626 / FGSC 10389) TaxID=936046 RepID=UPI00029F58C1|nr:hypothetical protein AGABI2DRAFT_190908 [Agaricus bisporus var. bisporus H97]EKV50643.1 hypothetical protein AGABI2DRAFT_190908 [Agaricus bisporus var. bisporus H97]